MEVEHEQRFIIDRVGEETDLEECSLCFAASCFSCLFDQCTALKKLSDGDCVFYKDYEENHKDIWRCFYQLIHCQRFDLLMKYADTLAALGLIDYEIAMVEIERERLEKHRMDHLKQLSDQNWKDGLVVVYPNDDVEEPDGEEEEPAEAPSVSADPEAVFDNSMDEVELPARMTDKAIDDETAEEIQTRDHEIVPTEAEIVRRIYRQYLEGFSPKMIADGLMEDGICTPSGGEKWYPSTVASILENEKYAGDLLMQKWCVEDYLTHKCVKNSGEKPQYFVEDDHDPIVPKAVFYQVQGEKKRRSALACDPSKLRFGNRLALNGRLICGKCGRTLKRYVKPQEELTDWRCRQRALVKKTDFHEDVPSRCDCRIVREVEAQRAVVMAFNELPRRREELVVARERLLTGEIGRIDALLKTIDEQQDSLEERLEVLASQVPEDEEAINTTVVDEVGSEKAVTGDMNEVDFLRTRIVELRRRKDALYAERAEHANTEVQIRLLLEMVDDMVMKSGTAPLWMSREAENENAEESGACRDYDDFFKRTRYTVPEGVLDENGRMERFNNDLVIRYLDRVVVQEDVYEVMFKAGVSAEIRI